METIKLAQDKITKSQKALKEIQKWKIESSNVQQQNIKNALDKLNNNTLQINMSVNNPKAFNTNLNSIKPKLDTYLQEQKSKKQILVTAEDIAYVVSKWTGIPVFKLEEGTLKLVTFQVLLLPTNAPKR